VPRAAAFARDARTRGFEATAQAAGAELGTTPMFTRTTLVPGLGQFTQAHGAAFALQPGQIGAPVISRDAVVVLRVDQRVSADKGAWQAQKAAQRQQVTAAARQARVRDYLAGLRETAKMEDNRRAVLAAQRNQSTT
jgi:hypothetical protein